MIYVQILGRMGNQMFSYAMARKLQLKNPRQEIVLDFSRFQYTDESWMNYLNYFDCKENLSEGIRHMNLIQRGILWFYFKKQSKIKSYLKLRKFEDRYAGLLEWFGLYIYTIGYHQYRYKSLFKNKLLLGFFETAEYFDDVSEAIRKDFQVGTITENPYAMELINDIQSHVSVAVGVRRGDFVSESNRGFCDVCTTRYYENAIERMKNLIGGGTEFKLFCFSDDIEWTRNNIKISVPVRYVTSSVHGVLKPWEMLQIMSICKYHIISNSSFFWWGQYLNADKDKMVIAPSRWRNIDGDVYRDIYQPNWICIDPDKG